jgi:hypothetical protein
MAEPEAAPDPAALATMLAYLRGHTRLPGYSENMWSPDHDSEAVEFLATPTIVRLFIFMHGNELVVTHNLHAHPGIHSSDLRYGRGPLFILQSLSVGAAYKSHDMTGGMRSTT